MMYKASKLIDRICEHCFSPFKARPYQVKVGDGRFCSHRCYMLNRPYDSLEVRLWKRVDQSGYCWIWKGYVNEDGYGAIADGMGGKIGTHRAAYILTYGCIPEGLKVLHQCDNPPCCRPDHLFLGTQAENIADMVKKGRNVYHTGELSPRAKLTTALVNEIRSQSTGQRGEQIRMAKEYGVCKQTISNVLNGNTW